MYSQVGKNNFNFNKNCFRRSLLCNYDELTPFSKLFILPVLPLLLQVFFHKLLSIFYPVSNISKIRAVSSYNDVLFILARATVRARVKLRPVYRCTSSIGRRLWHPLSCSCHCSTPAMLEIAWQAIFWLGAIRNSNYGLLCCRSNIRS